MQNIGNVLSDRLNRNFINLNLSERTEREGERHVAVGGGIAVEGEPLPAVGLVEALGERRAAVAFVYHEAVASAGQRLFDPDPSLHADQFAGVNAGRRRDRQRRGLGQYRSAGPVGGYRESQAERAAVRRRLVAPETAHHAGEGGIEPVPVAVVPVFGGFDVAADQTFLAGQTDAAGGNLAVTLDVGGKVEKEIETGRTGRH